MKKFLNSRMIVGFGLVVVLATPMTDVHAKNVFKRIGGFVKHKILRIDEKVDIKADDKAGEENDEESQPQEPAPPPPALTGGEVMPPPPPQGRNDNGVYVWTTDVQYINRAGRHGAAREHYEIQRMVSNLRHQGYRYEPVNVQVPIYQCAQTAASGSNWNGYYNLPREQKAAALASLIKGVGQSTAERLVRMNAFQPKPRSWQAFVEQVDQYDNQIEGLYNNVVVKYGTENRQTLGYGSTAGSPDDCVITGYRTKRTYEERYYDEPTGQFRATTFALNIEGGELLAQERESFKVSYTGDRGVFVEPVSVFNRYGVFAVDANTRDGYAEKTAQGQRLLVKPSDSLTVYTKWVNGEVVVEVTDLNFDANARLGTRTVYAKIIQNYNLGDRELKTVAIPMSGGWASFNTGVKKSDFQQGRLTLGGRVTEAYSKAAIQYSGSNYFSAERGAEKKSDKIRIQ